MLGNVARRSIRALAPAPVADLGRALRAARRLPGDGAASPVRRIVLARAVDQANLRFVPTACLRPGGCIVDVGAHEGSWSAPVIEALSPARLIAVEPNPEAFARLEQRLAGHAQAELHRCAVGAAAGRTSLHVAASSDFSSLRPPRPELEAYYGASSDEVGTVEVEVRALDELVGDEEEVLILKIDVQGSEGAVLDGGRRTLERACALLIEASFVSHYEGDLSFFELHRRLEDEFGLVLYSLAGPVYADDGRLLWADAVYGRPA